MLSPSVVTPAAAMTTTANIKQRDDYDSKSNENQASSSTQRQPAPQRNANQDLK